MVRVILDGFLLSGVLKPYEVVLSTRTRSKLNDLKETYPEIEIAYDNSSIVLKSNLLFYLLENQM